MGLDAQVLDFIKIEKAKLNDLIVDQGLNSEQVQFQSEKLDRLILVVQSQMLDEQIAKYSI